jgi:hypothetical protein
VDETGTSRREVQPHDAKRSLHILPTAAVTLDHQDLAGQTVRDQGLDLALDEDAVSRVIVSRPEIRDE